MRYSLCETKLECILCKMYYGSMPGFQKSGALCLCGSWRAVINIYFCVYLKINKINFSLLVVGHFKHKRKTFFCTFLYNLTAEYSLIFLFLRSHS